MSVVEQVSEISEKKASYKPDVTFSHFGMTTLDLPKMVDFYTRVLGFTITDQGCDHRSGMELVFLSRDPVDHHQVLLVNGRPENLPPNPFYPDQHGCVINQISFRVHSLDALRDLHQILVSEGVANIFPADHGISWSIYCHDPDGNNLEFFVDTDWYFPQPDLIPLDFTKSNAQISADTEARARVQPGFEMYSDWRARMAEKMKLHAPQH